MDWGRINNCQYVFLSLENINRMKFILLTLLFGIFFININIAQENAYHVDISVDHYDQDFVVIGYYLGDKQLVLDTLQKQDNQHTIGYGEDKILNNCTNGVYCIEFLHKENQRSLIVVLNDNILFE